MFRLATDFTYDLFYEDAKAYDENTAVDENNLSDDIEYRKYFMVHFKKNASKFKTQWLEKHGTMYASGYGYCGDAFVKDYDWGWFSDFYKDAYGQRPHLDLWFYVHAIGLPMLSDTTRTFCSEPIEDAIEDAKLNREFDY